MTRENTNGVSFRVCAEPGCILATGHASDPINDRRRPAHLDDRGRRWTRIGGRPATFDHDWLARAKDFALRSGENEPSQDAMISATIAIAERLDSLAVSLAPTELLEIVDDPIPALIQDKINDVVETMRQAAEAGAVPHVHMIEDPGDEQKPRTIKPGESSKSEFLAGTPIVTVVGLLCQEVHELKTVYGSEIAPALDRLVGGTGPDVVEMAEQAAAKMAAAEQAAEQAAGRIKGHVRYATSADAACPECYVLGPFGSRHHDGCVVGTIIDRLAQLQVDYNRGYAAGNSDFSGERADLQLRLDAIAKLAEQATTGVSAHKIRAIIDGEARS